MILRDRRGTAAFEFALVAVPFLLLMFSIFDLGRFAITMQSLRMLANAGARATMINCYTKQVIANKSPATCVEDYLTVEAKQAVAPFLFAANGDKPTLNTTVAAGALKITASQPKFVMLLPIWGTTLNAPSTSTTIPF
jgi:hypothetical protein